MGVSVSCSTYEDKILWTEPGDKRCMTKPWAEPGARTSKDKILWQSQETVAAAATMKPRNEFKDEEEDRTETTKTMKSENEMGRKDG